MYTQILQLHASVWPTEETLPYQPAHKVHTLPQDPRCWSREDVLVWLWNLEKLHGLPAISAERFHMNGKALCLMNVDMFVQRVPLGGKLLFKDFQMRLTQALYNNICHNSQ